eukprot:CAMPEP_0182512616 /NCGR_PEP_ID=MMETSP1321-20130603/32471_1 /TAXON_ID=91990 /ORGANISM="Bolidomonas sp., Strain RCC1657" /LENGTH=198 /DNA_ID=CAMNT_0024719479 /DNA_START=10 /DNA_END=602 /DNA_ORIENTATION=-
MAQILTASDLMDTTPSNSQTPVPSTPDYPELTSSLTSSNPNSGSKSKNGDSEYRRIRCPPHRYTPLRTSWEQILTPLVQYLNLLVRFNTKTRSVELKTSPTSSPGSLQKGADFVSCFMMGFEVVDAVALLRLDDLYLDSFQVTDVKMLKGDHLSRAIGRIAGEDGKTRYAIENATRTRIVLADQHVHILGSYRNIRVA